MTLRKIITLLLASSFLSLGIGKSYVMAAEIDETVDIEASNNNLANADSSNDEGVTDVEGSLDSILLEPSDDAEDTSVTTEILESNEIGESYDVEASSETTSMDSEEISEERKNDEEEKDDEGDEDKEEEEENKIISSVTLRCHELQTTLGSDGLPQTKYEITSISENKYEEQVTLETALEEIICPLDSLYSTEKNALENLNISEADCPSKIVIDYYLNEAGDKITKMIMK